MKAALIFTVLALTAASGLADRSLLAPTKAPSKAPAKVPAKAPARAPRKAPTTVFKSSAPAPAPGQCTTVLQTVKKNGLTTLEAAINKANLTSFLADPGLFYTVFAPTNAAFETAVKSLNLTTQELLDSDALVPTLENHLLAYPLKAADLLAARTVKTQYKFEDLNIQTKSVNGKDVVEVSDVLATANVVTPNVAACKSIVHVIDNVLLPST